MPSVTDQERFTLGTPALVCRWRLASGALPLENRHLRALGQRTVNDAQVTTELVAWAKQHIEWNLRDGSHDNPDGVLMLIIDDAGKAAMTVGPYEPLASAGVSDLAARARLSRTEADETGVAPETLWLVRDDVLVWGIGSSAHPAGADTLISDLASAVGLTVVRDDGLPDSVLAGDTAFDEVFLVSDEHGVVPAADASGDRSERFRQGYAKLLASMDAKARRPL